MKLSNAFALFGTLRLVLVLGLMPTIRAISKKPSLLLHPSLISREFMAHVWAVWGKGLDENIKGLKTSLITPNAHGVVLDLGAGHGHTAKYLDRTTVAKYVALEPNLNMHAEIRVNAKKAGFSEVDGTLLIVPYGAEDTALISSALGGAHAVDTLVSVLTLCGVPEARAAIRALAEDVLRPGGQVLFYEHVRSHRADIAWWQWLWTPIWKLAFDGCCLDRPTDVWLEELNVWESKDVWTDGDPDEAEEGLLLHRGGKLVKKL